MARELVSGFRTRGDVCMGVQLGGCVYGSKIGRVFLGVQLGGWVCKTVYVGLCCLCCVDNTEHYVCVLQESKSAEEKKNEKLAGSLEDLQSKNQKLMSALMVQSGQARAKLNNKLNSCRVLKTN